MSLQIIFFPSIIIFSISTILIPDLASNTAKNDLDAIKRRIKQVISLAFILGIIVLILCLSIGEKLGQLLFKEVNLGNYLHFLAFCAPLIYLTQVSRSILNGLVNKNLSLNGQYFFFNSSHFTLFFSCIPKINIYGLWYNLDFYFFRIISNLFS